MDLSGVSLDRLEAEESARIGALWWLWVPLGVLVLLALLALLAPGFNRDWIEGEQGLLEISHVLLTASALMVALRCFGAPGLAGRPWLVAWVALMALGSFYIAGEEMSWGQHFFFWTTPEGWQSINDQQETNLHNVSNWFDQIPRTILEVAIVFGGIVIPLATLARPGLRRSALGIVLPPLALLPTSVLVEVSRAPERIGERLGWQSIIFERPSEVQEFYFTYFILLYAILLRRRLLREPAVRA